jgi:hypothetical protein
MLLGKGERPILIVNLIYLPAFTAVALTRSNWEFVLYAGVVLLVALWIFWKQRDVRFDRSTLWGLSLWGFLHMAGGNVPVEDGVLYGLQLVPVLLRYDQLVHLIGFGVVTLVCFHLLRPYLRPDTRHWGALSVLVVLMGSGVGALNEIIEYIVDKIVTESGVGGYDNTLRDLIFNLIGGMLAVLWLTWRRRLARLNPATTPQRGSPVPTSPDNL